MDVVLGGSVRDDGPLPDVYTDVIEGQRAMRAQLAGVGFCVMVATMLHSIATGNILREAVEQDGYAPFRIGLSLSEIPNS